MKITAKHANRTALIISLRLAALNGQLEGLKGSNNPQVIFSVKELNAERLALEHVLKSLQGDHVLLNCFARVEYSQ